MNEIHEAVVALKQAEGAIAEATKVRDDAVRQAIAEGVPVASIADTAGLSKARVYQIRDRRR